MDINQMNIYLINSLQGQKVTIQKFCWIKFQSFSVEI